MNIIEFCLIPVLMLVGYYLTYITAKYCKSTYDLHYITERIDMGPIWGNDSNNLKFPNYKMLLLWATIIACCVPVFFSHNPKAQWTIDWYKGFIFSTLIIDIAGLLNSLLLFKYMANKNDAVTGTITLTKEYQLKFSQYQTLVCGLPIVALTVLNPTGVMIGASCGCISRYIGRLILLRSNREIKKVKS